MVQDSGGALELTVGSAGAAEPKLASEVLGDADTAALFARLESLPSVTPTQAPIMRPPSAPPPKSGNVTSIAFVAPTGRAVADRPIAPHSDQPAAMDAPEIIPGTGEAVLGAELHVRFADAMVPVAEVGATRAQLATIDPPVAGSWRWDDTHVAVFVPAAGHLPGSTKLTVTVAAGARSIANTFLAAPVTATFTTPPIDMLVLYPRGVLRPDAPIAVHFTQRIDRDAVAKQLRFTVKGVAQPVRVIDVAEARALWKRQPHLEIEDLQLTGNMLVVAPKTAWPSGAEVLVTLAKGATSAEGPIATTRAQVESFHVAPAFELRGISCDSPAPRMHAVCPALSWPSLALTNAIERSSFRAELVQLEGEPFDDRMLSTSDIELGELSAAIGASHTVKIGDGLLDIYGQSYAGPHRISFTTTKPHWDEYLAADDGLYVLDPRYQTPLWTVTADAVPSLHVQLYAAQPSDYFAYEQLEAGKLATPPGKRVFDHVYPVGARFAAEARVDLHPALSASGTGHVIAIATGGSQPRRVAWIEVTRLGVVARLDGEQANAWASDISPASFMAPIPHANARLLLEHAAPTAPAETDGDGHVALALPGPAIKPDAVQHTALLELSTATDSAFLPIDRDRRSIRTRTAEWYVTDDRFTYKPGEPLYIKGWVRWTHDGVNPGIEMPETGQRVTYTVNDSRGVEIAKGTTALTAQGGFDFQAALPATANLGTAYVALSLGSETTSHPFQIEEFRTPAFSLSLDDDVVGAGTLPLVVGESIEMRAEARYYSGGGLGGAKVSWDTSLRRASYRPVGFDAFTFEPALARNDGGPRIAQIDSRLDSRSTGTVDIGVAALPFDAPSLLRVDAIVTDLDRSVIRASSRAIVVHPSSYYVGLRMKPESTDTVEAVVVDLDNHPVAGVPIDVDFTGMLYSEWYRDDANIKDTQHCHAISAATPVPCTLHIASDKYGYLATAHVSDARGRANSSRIRIPRWGGPDDRQPLTLTADKPKYRAGDVAKLTITSDVVPSHAVVSYARQGLVAQRSVLLDRPKTVIDVPIDVSYLEDVHVVVDRFARRAYMTSPQVSKEPLPEHVEAEIDLPIDKRGAELAVTAKPNKPSVAPGEPATFDVTVAKDGKPVAGAEVALMVVDEAVLALSGAHHEDPLEPFYRTVENGTEAASSLELVHDAGIEVATSPGFDRVDLDGLLGHGSGTGSGYGIGGGRGAFGTVGHGSGSATIASRKDFRATAVWAPSLVTDANGHARMTVTMPDSLTRYRVVALASKGPYFFGKVEDAIATRREVNARIVAPRFLTQGDAFELPVVVQNLDTKPREISVVARAANLAGDGPMGRRVTVPAGQRAEVRFGFHTIGRGRAAIQTAISSGDRSDASVIELPIYEPATTESFATYGVVDGDAPVFERLAVPTDIFKDVGGVEAEIASTQMQSLTDAYWYLQAYPYECAEQRSSRMLATAAMADVLSAFEVPGRPSPDDLAAQHAKDVEKLTTDQLPDGSWGYWPGTPSDPFVTMQVMQALAHDKGAARAVAKARDNVTKLMTKTFAALAKRPDARDRLGTAYDIMVAADALTALAAVGADVSTAAQSLHATAKRLGVYPLDAKAELLAIVAKLPRAAAMRAELASQLVGAARQTSAGASVSEAYATSLAALLPSTARTTALVMNALIREAPSQPLIAKLAHGLLGEQRGGRWRTTQENLAVLQAMRRYFDTYEHATPDFTGKLWLGEGDYLEHAFVGHTSDRVDTALGWSALPAGSHDLAIVKTGPGRLYYRVGITYAPAQMPLPALDAGYIVRRSYEAVDDPSDVVKTAAGWTIRLGARVRVRLEASCTTQNSSVALVDPMPAGFEAINTRLATSERAPKSVSSGEWNHVELRDERAEAFALDLEAGTHAFSYAVRATTPGTFIAAPAKAEDMYEPETFGRSTSETVTIR